MKTSLLCCALLSLFGCATCREHPLACVAAGGIVLGGVTVAVSRHSAHVQIGGQRTTQPVNCSGGLCQ
jgi:hypothetical protein